MNYEKLYKEALSRAKYWEKQPTVWNSADICQKLFPELKESEDERIRKAIIEHIDCKNKELHIDSNDSITVADAIAWLEKQGEQKPIIIIPQFKVGDIIKPKPYNEEHLIKDINENGYVLDVDIIIPLKDEDVWEIVEQKSAWKPSEEQLSSLGRFIEGVYGCVDFTNIKSLYNDLKNL